MIDEQIQKGVNLDEELDFNDEMSFFNFDNTDIDGNPVDIKELCSGYKAILVVNVASLCDYAETNFT
jgi:hypothetical protein